MSQSGFLILDKPTGITSFDLVAQVRRTFQIKKVGHLGTLDPLATGVLVVAVGEATKLIEYFMKLDKVYEAQVEFGKTSDTYDRLGQIRVVEPSPAFSQDQPEAALSFFRGTFLQTPPSFSAIKVQGQRAYRLARAGTLVELPARSVTVHALDILRFELPYATLRIHCSSGTYIRSLIHDLGTRLGCGALMTELRRLAVGPFMLENAAREGEWTASLISLEHLVRDWPSIHLTLEEYQALRQGQFIGASKERFSSKDVFGATPTAAFYDQRLVSLVEPAPGGGLKPVKNFVVEG